MEQFLTRFQWDSAKFPLRQPLPNIVDGISKVSTDICLNCVCFSSLKTQLYYCLYVACVTDRY